MNCIITKATVIAVVVIIAVSIKDAIMETLMSYSEIVCIIITVAITKTKSIVATPATSFSLHACCCSYCC